jgi:transposase
LIHRHKLVEIRARVKNGLQHLAMNRGMQKKSQTVDGSRTEGVRRVATGRLGSVPQRGSAAAAAVLDSQIGQLDEAAQRAADDNEQARLLMTQPGVGPITSLAFVLTLGEVARFKRGKQVASYLGLIPREHSSGGKQHLGGSASKATALRACCWWRRRRRPHGWMKGFASSINTAATASRRAWQGGGGTQVGSPTLLDAAHERRRIRRSFVSRAARGWPWTAQASPLN